MNDRLHRQSSPCWGHKVTVHIYVEGDITQAAHVSEEVCAWLDESDPCGDPYIETAFVGVMIDEVHDEPKEMMGT